jgi:hypothetical protein
VGAGSDSRPLVISAPQLASIGDTYCVYVLACDNRRRDSAPSARWSLCSLEGQSAAGGFEPRFRAGAMSVQYLSSDPAGPQLLQEAQVSKSALRASGGEPIPDPVEPAGEGCSPCERR